jgi:GDPmannose 4,6-dehydratase
VDELGIKLRFEGKGVDEVAVVEAVTSNHAPGLKPGQVVLRIDPRYFRPAEVETLLGDPTMAKQKLGWMPEITAQEMCREMVAHDLRAARRAALLKQYGYEEPVALES